MRSLSPWAQGHVEAEPHVMTALASEPRIAELIDTHGPYRWALLPPFRSLVHSIVYQRVSGSSATAVFGRLDAATGVTPGGLLAADRAVLRSAGLSWSKVDAVQRAAAFTLAGGLDGIAAMDDAAVVAHLTQLKGVGPWTAEMVLLFSLGRLDVWPVGDLAVRQQIERRYGIEGRAAVGAVGERFRPYRSVVAWYLWRASAGPQADGTRESDGT